MKNILLITVLIGVLCTACTPDPILNPVVISLSKYTVNEHCLSANSKDILVMVHNTNNRDIDIEWKHNKDLIQTGWSYTINNTTAHLGTLSIPANSSASILLTVAPNGNVGEGTGTIEFYDVADPSISLQTCTYHLTSIASYFRIAQGTAMVGSVPITTIPNYDYTIWLINDNNIPIDVKWARTNEVYPNPWWIAAKTSTICYAPNTMSSEVTLPANDSIPFRLIFDHQNTTGTGRSIPNFWVEEDSINSAKNQAVGHSVTP